MTWVTNLSAEASSIFIYNCQLEKEKLALAIQKSLCPGNEVENSPLASNLP